MQYDLLHLACGILCRVEFNLIMCLALSLLMTHFPREISQNNKVYCVAICNVEMLCIRFHYLISLDF